MRSLCFSVGADMPTFHLTRLGAFALMLAWITMLAWGAAITSRVRSMHCVTVPTITFN